MASRSRVMVMLLLLSALTLAPSSALAVTCTQWNRLGPYQKSDAIGSMIQRAISGSGGRSYHVDRGAIARCLDGQAQSMMYDFDSICADSRSAGMRAIENAFKDYIWSCAR